jgi:hypothetical protein
MPSHPTATSLKAVLLFGLGAILFAFGSKVLILEIWRVRAANRWFEGKTSAGHKTIKFTQAPYTEISFAISFGVFVLSMIIALFLLTHA